MTVKCKDGMASQGLTLMESWDFEDTRFLGGFLDLSEKNPIRTPYFQGRK